jgi:arginine:ornithine antiporter/lysine permease
LSYIVAQLLVISPYWVQGAFSLMLKMTSVMTLIPYFLVAAYGFLIANRGETYDRRPEERTRNLVIAGLAAIYTAFMLYAGGMKFIPLCAVLYAPGTLPHFWARRKQNKQVFTAVEWSIFIVAVVGCIVGIHGLATGYITI